MFAWSFTLPNLVGTLMKLNLSALPVVATAATLALATVAVAPAQAATITLGSQLNLASPISGGVQLVGSNNFNFFGEPVIAGNQGISVTTGTGSFANTPLLSPIRPLLPVLNPQRLPRIADLNGLLASGNLLTYTGPRLNDFIKNMEFGPGLFLPSSPLSFDLISFVYDTTTATTTSLTGFFRSGADEIGATGRFTTQLDIANPSSYSITLTTIPTPAIPTPALLPGLFGLGAAAWRKRKSEKAEVAA
jgi:hypothetical protein